MIVWVAISIWFELMVRLVPKRLVWDEPFAYSMSPMFPWNEIRHRYQIEQVSVDSEHSYPQSVLIQARSLRSSQRVLWSCVPLSIRPPQQPLVRMDHDFDWAVNSNHTLMVMSEMSGRVSMYTVNDDHVWSVCETLESPLLTSSTRWSVVKTGTGKAQTERFVGLSDKGLVRVDRVGHNRFALHPIRVSMWRFGLPSSFAVGSHHLVHGMAQYRQWDGVVDVFYIDPFVSRLERNWKLEAPSRGTGFGMCCQIFGDRLVVSAPFTPNPMFGAGVVYVYSLKDRSLVQTIGCPETFSAAEQGHLQFGWYFVGSASGEFLAITVRRIDGDRVYVFKYHARQRRYTYQQNHQLMRLQPDQPLKFAITDYGHVIVWDHRKSHWLIRRPSSRFSEPIA